MALDRTWFNALVDDDGSGLTGSVWDKADIANLLNSVDAEIARLDSVRNAGALGNSIVLAPSGVVADYNPANGAATIVWLMQVAVAGTYLTGIVAPPVPGAQHLLINAGQPFTISNDHSASSVNNRFYCPGFADYVLTSWFSVWIYHSPHLGKWIVQKET